MPYHRSVEMIAKLPVSPLLVVGNRPEILAHAVETQLPAVIITGLKHGEEIAIDMSDFRGSIYLSKTDTAETIRILRLSSPVHTIMDRDVPRLTWDTPFEKRNQTYSTRNIAVFQSSRETHT